MAVGRRRGRPDDMVRRRVHLADVGGTRFIELGSTGDFPQRITHQELVYHLHHIVNPENAWYEREPRLHTWFYVDGNPPPSWA